MTAPDPKESVQEAEPTRSASEQREPESQPEPWTPQRVLEWNWYYDIYVIAGVLLLALVGSIHPVVDSSLWSDLQTGKLIATDGPVTRDPFSYTMYKERWVDIPWVFQLTQAKVYELAASLGKTNPEKVAVATLILLNAVLRMVTALILLQVRRSGPGAWWAAVCVFLALGGIWMPFPGGQESPVLPVLGGIAGSASLNSSTWSVLLLTIELLLLFRASRGSARSLIGLVPLFLLWANTDDSFLFGILVLALSVFASLFGGRGRDGERPRVAPAWWFGALAACVAATMVNPWFWWVYPVAAEPWVGLFKSSGVLTTDRLSFFGRKSWEYFDAQLGNEGGNQVFIAYYAILVGLGLTSFVLNRARFDLGRFLVFAVTAVLWGFRLAFGPMFGPVFAITMALNGQEWYLRRYGVEGRLGSAWSVWSVGGRAVTLVLVFALVFKGMTGTWASPYEPVFGLGANTDEFAFEAAEFLGKAPIEGNVLNFRLAQGDALIWKAWPVNRQRKTFLDSRSNLFPPRFQETLQSLRHAFAEGKTEDWKPILDEYNVSVVMLWMLDDRLASGRVYNALARSTDWIPFYDDGVTALFGRMDASPTDIAFFKENQLDAERLAFRTVRAVPSSDRTPTPTGWIDRIFKNRNRRNPQPHYWAARRWLTVRRDSAEQPPNPAECLLAIAQARAALAIAPDDSSSWNILDEAYRLLFAAEGEILQKASVNIPPTNYYRFRLQQRLTVLNFTILSFPPPTSSEEREALSTLHQQLAELYLGQGFIDLSRDQLVEARELAGTEGLSEELDQTLEQLEAAITRLETSITDLMAQQQVGPLQITDFALQQGPPGSPFANSTRLGPQGLTPMRSRPSSSTSTAVSVAPTRPSKSSARETASTTPPSARGPGRPPTVRPWSTS